MVKGKICLSVAANTSTEFVDKATRAAGLASLIELRFDSLDPAELSGVWSGLFKIRKAYSGTVIATYRSSENGQGGFRYIPREKREAFWKSPEAHSVADWADVEADIDERCLLENGVPRFEKVIRSFHSFDGTLSEVELRATLSRLHSPVLKTIEQIAKIACVAEDITDSIPVWKLIEGDPGISDGTIALSMGEFGTWTRILGPAFGSLITYAPPPDGEETAPGQASYSDLRDLYRVEELDRSTAVYGITGFPARHSTSPYIHNRAFAHEDLNCVYLPLPARDLKAFFRRMVAPGTREIAWNLKGLSITHPHKQAVIELLDKVDDRASAIGAVNTVRIEENEMVGFNTDCAGFVQALSNGFGRLKDVSAGIIGTGGAARAAAYGLVSEGAEVTFFSRNRAGESLEFPDRSIPIRPLTDSDNCFSSIDILVNATPQGSKGVLENQTPALAVQMQNLQLAFDMVYNPKVTRFLREADDARIPSIGGIAMLIEQAILQFEIWTGRPAPLGVMKAAVLSRN